VAISIHLGQNSLHSIDIYAQKFKLFAADTHSSELSSQPVQRAADICEFVGTLVVDLANEDASVDLHLHQTRLLQLTKRLTNWTAADAQTIGNRLLVYARARLKFLTQN